MGVEDAVAVAAVAAVLLPDAASVLLFEFGICHGMALVTVAATAAIAASTDPALVVLFEAVVAAVLVVPRVSSQ
jgi:hypothetical protein